jgi:oxygen-independent coproporphyrinogen-3 oxidase
VTLAGEERRAQWERSLKAEASMYGDLLWAFDTVYFGGGTPSSLGIDRLARVVDGLKARLRIGRDARWFLEVNPEDVTVEAARAWRESGFSSVSVGVQALDDEILRVLGRRHTSDDARRAVVTLLEAGFETVSIDLIFGIDGQQIAGWKRQLTEAAAMGSRHLSCYQLTFHQGTIFGRRREAGLTSEMGEGAQAEFFRTADEILGCSGFEHYEVSNWAQPHHRSAHNTKYWTGTPYLGLGPGAHSFDGRFRRWWNRRKLRLWHHDIEEGRSPIEDQEILTPVQRALEELMLGLRTADGVDLAAIERRWNIGLIKPNAGLIRELLGEGLIRVREDQITPTSKGMAVADGIIRAFRLEAHRDAGVLSGK